MNLLKHKPVLLAEILSLIPSPIKLNQTKGWFLDATFGAGGHTKALLNRYPSLSTLALDCDPLAIKWGVKHIKPLFPDDRLRLFHANFHDYMDLKKSCLSPFLNGKKFDIILLDLGVSSPQLDTPNRGFSFYKDGPLDMRMDTKQDFSAEHVVNSYSEYNLINLFREYGEVKNPRKVVKAIVKERQKQALMSTRQLANLIIKHEGWRKKGRHPATAYFLALRIKVNNELQGLKHSLPYMLGSLSPGGRAFVLTFHSLEDRIVKNIFKTACTKTEKMNNKFKKAIKPTREEIKTNPRARSAKLRVFENV